MTYARPEWVCLRLLNWFSEVIVCGINYFRNSSIREMIDNWPTIETKELENWVGCVGGGSLPLRTANTEKVYAQLLPSLAISLNRLFIDHYYHSKQFSFPILFKCSGKFGFIFLFSLKLVIISAWNLEKWEWNFWMKSQRNRLNSM
jgi:hypothetical protein